MTQIPEPAKLTGKAREIALAEAEAAAERELDLLISDNSLTWAL